MEKKKKLLKLVIIDAALFFISYVFNFLTTATASLADKTGSIFKVLFTFLSKVFSLLKLVGKIPFYILTAILILMLIINLVKLIINKFKKSKLKKADKIINQGKLVYEDIKNKHSNTSDNKDSSTLKKHIDDMNLFN